MSPTTLLTSGAGTPCASKLLATLSEGKTNLGDQSRSSHGLWGGSLEICALYLPAFLTSIPFLRTAVARFLYKYSFPSHTPKDR
eukprot:scaffold7117_cov104-Cylindrotheca_fusiformis.AAC.2